MNDGPVETPAFIHKITVGGLFDPQGRDAAMTVGREPRRSLPFRNKSRIHGPFCPGTTPPAAFDIPQIGDALGTRLA